MTRAEAMIEAMARAMCSNDAKGKTTQDGRPLVDLVWKVHRRDCRAALAAILPLLADDLAGVAIDHAQTEEEMRDACRKSKDRDGAVVHASEAIAARVLANAMKAHLASLAAAMKGEG